MPPGSDGQVSRVAGRFGVIAAAGEMAIAADILCGKPGDATAAAARCFSDWLTARGTVGSGEQQSAVRQVRHFIELHGASRFQEIHPAITPAMLRKPNSGGLADEGDSHLSDRWINNMAGYKKTERDGATRYLIWPEVWRQEVCKGMDGEQASKALHDRGLLTKDVGKGHWTKKMRLPGDAKTYRFFVVSSAILAADDDEADD